ncbi:MAG: ABC transporter permease [Spirochaetes bacterium]|nr:ABC transporter permease [Spirochaetota bacterium]
MMGTVFAAMLPVLATALGGLFTEASGILNIALEGLLTVGAFASVAAGTGYTSAFAAAAAAGLLFASLLAFVTFRMKADPFVAALAFNLAVQGGCSVLSEHLFGTKGVVPAFFAAGASSVARPTGFSQGFLDGFKPGVPVLVVLSALLVVVFTRTVFGLRVRAAGGNEDALAAGGIDPVHVRFAAYAVSGVAAGLAGAYLVSDIGAWVPGIAAGRGWTALVAVYLGRKSVAGTVAASIGFGLAFALADAAQGFAVIPGEFSIALPYALAVIVAATGRASDRLGRDGRNERGA